MRFRLKNGGAGLGLEWGLIIGAMILATPLSARQIEYAAIYQRTTNFVAEAVFYKPSGDEEDLSFRLAPLIMQGVELRRRDNDAGGDPGQPASTQENCFGALINSNLTSELDFSRPTLYFEPGSVRAGGKIHPQFTYLWFNSANRRRTPGELLPMQGVRLTLNSRGEPVIWEVLADPSGADIIYVSAALEAAARAQFGRPLVGRKYAIERGLKDAPRTVVARVIDDGPVPMGPVVYLEARTGAVMTLLCRCMPVQTKGVWESRAYALAPLGFAGSGSPASRFRAQRHARTAFWPGKAAPRLEQKLRLPQDF